MLAMSSHHYPWALASVVSSASSPSSSSPSSSSSSSSSRRTSAGSSSSVNSVPATSLKGRLRNFASNMTSPPRIDIFVESSDYRIPTFTTGERISGHIEITCCDDRPFERVEICLRGTVRCVIDQNTPSPAGNSRQEIRRDLLTIAYDPNPALYPEPRVFRGGKTYSFPFAMDIPEKKDPECLHPVDAPIVTERHNLLPPSFGEHDIAGYGNTLMDDMAPERSQISYFIRAGIMIHRADETEAVLKTQPRKIRLIPNLCDQPPVTFDEEDGEFCTRLEKAVHKNIIVNRLGCLVMESLQPLSMQLPLASQIAGPYGPDVTTPAHVNLRFDPATATSEPPRVSYVASALKARTFYATAPRKNFPNKKEVILNQDLAYWSDTQKLSKRTLPATTEWVRHDTAEAVSVSTRHAIPAASSEARPGLPFWTLTLTIPVALPKTKVYVPTFHNCYIARSYILKLSLSIVGNTDVKLRVPIQITSTPPSRTREDIGLAMDGVARPETDPPPYIPLSR